MNFPLRPVHRPRSAAWALSKGQRGVTLVEVIAATSIAAILLGMAAPSLVDSMQANRARSSAHALFSLLVDARSEAVKRNVPVLVCPSSDGANCLTTVTAASWAGQAIACYDADGDGTCDASTLTAPNPIRIRGAAENSVQVTGPTAAVRFNGMGAASAASFAVASGTKSSAVSVAATGAVRAY